MILSLRCVKTGIRRQAREAITSATRSDVSPSFAVLTLPRAHVAGQPEEIMFRCPVFAARVRRAGRVVRPAGRDSTRPPGTLDVWVDDLFELVDAQRGITIGLFEQLDS
jgi:hypothetical protein